MKRFLYGYSFTGMLLAGVKIPAETGTDNKGSEKDLNKAA